MFGMLLFNSISEGLDATIHHEFMKIKLGLESGILNVKWY